MSHSAGINLALRRGLLVMYCKFVFDQVVSLWFLASKIQLRISGAKA